MTPIRIALAASLALAGCTPPTAPSTDSTSGPSILTVNDMTLSADAFTVYTRTRTGKAPEELTDVERDRLLDEAVKLLVVADEAKKRGLGDDADTRGQLELQRLNLLAQTMIRSWVEQNPVSDEAIAAESDQQNAGSQREYRARHILVETEDKAKGLIAQLDHGADFAELAKEHSTGPSSTSGGDLGWFTHDQMVGPFADAVAELDDGAYTKAPVQTQYGWHVILAEGSRDVAAPPPEQVRQQVAPKLQKEAIEAFIDRLVTNATIQKNPD